MEWISGSSHRHLSWRVFGSLMVALSSAMFVAMPRALGENDSDRNQLINVGATGILCLRQPCAHRGVFLGRARDLQARRAALLYADIDGHAGPPHLIASNRDARSIRRAWKQMRCLQVRGRFENAGANLKPTLHIDRILGSCR